MEKQSLLKRVIGFLKKKILLQWSEISLSGVTVGLSKWYLSHEIFDTMKDFVS
jgi:hypothetical protein